MLDNPIVVFVKPGELGKRAEDFPIGWRSDGTVVSPALLSREGFSVLFLDDTQEVPEAIAFTNRDSGRPLLIVAHNTSKENTSSRIVDNTVLKSWGRPYICDFFSHLNGNHIWEDIKLLTSARLPLTEFVARRRAGRDLELCDRLAAICQINMIDSSLDTSAALSETLAQLPIGLTEPFDEKLNQPSRSWPELLDLVRHHAAPLT